MHHPRVTNTVSIVCHARFIADTEIDLADFESVPVLGNATKAETIAEKTRQAREEFESHPYLFPTLGKLAEFTVAIVHHFHGKKAVMQISDGYGEAQMDALLTGAGAAAVNRLGCRVAWFGRDVSRTRHLIEYRLAAQDTLTAELSHVLFGADSFELRSVLNPISSALTETSIISRLLGPTVATTWESLPNRVRADTVLTLLMYQRLGVFSADLDIGVDDFHPGTSAAKSPGASRVK